MQTDDENVIKEQIIGCPIPPDEIYIVPFEAIDEMRENLFSIVRHSKKNLKY